MSKRKLRRPRQLARAIHYKQAGAVEEALRQRGVIAHVQPGWSGQSLLVHVADPSVPAEYLDEHAASLAEALYADAVAICSTGRTFIVAPGWLTEDDADAAAAESAWPPADESELDPGDPGEAELPAWPEGVRLIRPVEAFGPAQSAVAHAVLGGDGAIRLLLTADCDPAAVRAALEQRQAAIATAIGAASCRIEGNGRQVTITPVPQSGPAAAPGAERR